MPITTIYDYIDSGSLVLMEGSVIERLKREHNLEMDETLLNAPLLYDGMGKSMLMKIYVQYLMVAAKINLPMIVLLPTWKANYDACSQAGLDCSKLHKDAYHFLRNMIKTYFGQKEEFIISGLMGPKGDAYDPEIALEPEEAVEFHKRQVVAMKNTAIDMITVSTLPALTEALGIAMLLSDAKIPYVISFVIRNNGTLLDGTALDDAIYAIDGTVEWKPFGYYVNCVHPDNLLSILNNNNLDHEFIKSRLKGLQANASAKPPEELDNAASLDADTPENWANKMIEVRNKFGINILGGCCGTDNRHIEALADAYKKYLISIKR